MAAAHLLDLVLVLRREAAELPLGDEEIQAVRFVQGYVRPYQCLQVAVGTALLRGQGRFEQLLVELLDQFEQQVLLAFEMVVQGARDYLQVLGQFAHANPCEATLGKEFESLATDLLEPGTRSVVRGWKSLPGDGVGGQALANQWTPSLNSVVAAGACPNGPCSPAGPATRCSSSTFRACFRHARRWRQYPGRRRCTWSPRHNGPGCGATRGWPW
ncbi:hypothetical protein D3C76_1161650 [compost metagenome]